MTDERASVAEMVREGIARAREKLIDLSLRDGMLNYRHSESSNRHVRIVGQTPTISTRNRSCSASNSIRPLRGWIGRS
ncbi:hypothetical protein [Methylocapsa palsarum]|uniref:Uncharacterized protein n=1 Tax=Methylocapsa palsarum TaxID=1612308 RepID=A0A1I3YRV2_9HYPH|nr:hypothetical protein [Methylocapsa palsarum]SFK33971.1 hypothetical protein SAMN05444581_10698 [Methylocapsa palsarum]